MDGTFVYLLVLIGLVAAGLVVQIIWPGAFWRLERWKFRDSERAQPSETYLGQARMLSAFVLAFLVIITVCGYLGTRPDAEP